MAYREYKTLGEDLSFAPEKWQSDYVMLDLETTGLSEDDQIIEAGAVRYIDGKEVASFSSLIRPKRYQASDLYITPKIQRLTGIVNEDFRDAGQPERVLPALRDFIGQSVIVGHNIPFDIAFLHRGFERYLGMPCENAYADTLKIARRVLNLQQYRLEDIAGYFHISYDGAHRALRDARIESAVLDCLLAYMETPESADGLEYEFTFLD